MKKTLLPEFFTITFLILIFTNAKSQTVAWAKKGISPGFEVGNAIVADDSGNVYVTGQLEFTSVFDNVSLTSYGQHDIMVAKYNSIGVLKWIRHAGGTHGDIGLGIGIDAQHNVYITGEIELIAKFSNTISLTSSGNNDGFIAKYDANGNVLWAKSFGNSGSSDKGRAIAVSPSGNCYITGNFSSSISFGSTSLSGYGANDIFVAKFDNNGNALWAKKAGGTAQDRGYGIAIDASENVYVTGSFTASAKFKNTTITNSGSLSAFVAKYNSGGTFQWVKAGGDCCDTTQGNSIALDELGDVYIAGSFAMKAKFSGTTLTSNGLTDIFLAKYSSSGSFQWAKRAGSVNEDVGYGIAVDKNAHRVYVTGFVASSGSASGMSYSFAGYKDVWLASYTTDGSIKWVKTYGGTRRDMGQAITVNSQGFIFTTGIFNGTAPFGPITLTGYPNQPWADFFVNKIIPPVPPLPDYVSREEDSFNYSGNIFNKDFKINSGKNFSANVFPNPFNTSFNILSDEIISFRIFDVLGNLLVERKYITSGIDIGNELSPGVYYLDVDNGGAKKTFQLIKND